MPSKMQAGELESGDFIIVVIGPVGSGKSTFIAKATGNHCEDPAQGFCSGSHTKGVQATSLVIGDHSNVILVDTPGFDTENATQLNVLATVSRWLRQTYKRKATAVLCFHSISENRIRWALHDKALQGLCEDVTASRIFLVTTMWDEVDKKDANARLAELRNDFWKAMVSQGSRIFQHSNTSESTEKLLREVIGNDTTIASCSADYKNSQHSNTTESAEGPPLQEGTREDIMRSSCSVRGTEKMAVVDEMIQHGGT